MDKFSECLWRSAFEVVYGWIYKADVVAVKTSLKKDRSLWLPIIRATTIRAS